MPNEPIQGGPYPLQSQRADVPGDIKKVVDWAAPKLNMTFASTGERDAQVTSPEDGMFCTIGSGSAAETQVYMDGDWRAIMTKAVVGRRGGGTPTLPSGSTTEMNFGPLTESHGGVTVSGNGLQVPTGGLYYLDGGARCTGTGASSGDRWQMRLYVNGTIVAVNQDLITNGYLWASITKVLSAGDVVTVSMYNYASAPFDLSANFALPTLGVTLIART